MEIAAGGIKQNLGGDGFQEPDQGVSEVRRTC
jgi:hypothetical protein